MESFKLGKYAFIPGGAADPAVTKSFGELLDANIQDYTGVLDRLTSKVEKAATSRKYTATGLSEKRKELGLEELAKIDELHNGTRLAALQQKLKAAKEGAPDARMPNHLDRAKTFFGGVQTDPAIIGGTVAVVESQWKEIRDKLWQLEPAIRGIMLEASVASESNLDADLLGAVYNAPKPFRDQLVKPDVLDELVRKYWQLRKPDQYMELITVQRAIDQYEANWHKARLMVNSICGVVVWEPDPLVAGATNAGRKGGQ
jgi:hypothetical protein